jgi:spore coat polysaccharide biosynthesis protein SpsF
MTTGLVIFARLDSTRLPVKVLREVAGRPLLGRVIDQARRVPGELSLVVATSDRIVDDPIVAFAKAEDVPIFRGPVGTLARAVQCARAHGFKAVARICGDSPFMQPDIFDVLINKLHDENLDIATNVFPRSFPIGISAEVIATAALARVEARATDPDDRDEDCTRYFYSHPEEFCMTNVAMAGPGRADLSLAVDTAADLERTEWMIARLRSDAEATDLNQLIALAEAWAERPNAGTTASGQERSPHCKENTA